VKEAVQLIFGDARAGVLHLRVQRSRVGKRCANDKAALACPRHRLERIDRRFAKT
jgi:hypothetical protein